MCVSWEYTVPILYVETYGAKCNLQKISGKQVVHSCVINCNNV